MSYPKASDLPSEPQFTAAELLEAIRRRDGRIFRMREVCVFVLTTNEETARWLLDLGAKSFLPPNLTPAERGPRGGYVRDRQSGLIEWDVYIHVIPVRGDESIWEAAGRPPEEKEEEAA